MPFNISPLQTLALFDVAKLFWNASFKIEDLHLNTLHQIIEPNWDSKLLDYREDAIRLLNAFIKDSKIPQSFKNILTNYILLLQKAYHKLLLWKSIYDPDNNIDLLQKGELYAPNYFTLDGEFNDIAWSKSFVLNPNCQIIDRFNIASSFWFENECENLLNELKELHRTPFKGNDDFFREDFLHHFGQNSPLTQLWLLKLENQRNSPYQKMAIEEGFWQISFNYTVSKGYEHAVYFIWQKLSDFEKYAVTQSDRFFEFISLGNEYPRDNISYFLFSQLSEVRKEDFLSWSEENNIRIYQGDVTEVWLNLLFPLYAKAMRSEILKFIYLLPIDMFTNLLQTLSYRIKQFKLPLDAHIFQVLWSKLTSEAKHDVLDRGIFIIENLVNAKSFYNLGFIVKGLSFVQKERCLIHGMYGAGIDSLDILKNEPGFDLWQKYLSFFLFDIDLVCEKQTLNKDNISLLQTFTESSDFIRWCKYKLGKRLGKMVKDEIDIMQTSATLLYELCEKVC